MREIFKEDGDPAKRKVRKAMQSDQEDEKLELSKDEEEAIKKRLEALVYFD